MTQHVIRLGQKPMLKIRPVSGWQAIDLREIWVFRDLLFTLAGRDVKVRYKQTALGVVWVVFQPLIAAAIFAFLFGRVARFEAPGQVPYFLFAFAGLMAWNLFSSTLSRTTGSMVSNAHLVAKVYFPRAVLPLSSIFSTLIDFIVTMLLLLILLGIYWQVPLPTLLLLPIPILILLTFALGFGLLASALSVRFRDVGYILPVLTQFLMWGSPVAYATEIVPAQYLDIYRLNPLVSVLEMFKYSVLGVGEFSWSGIAYSSTIAVLILAIGAFAFRRMEADFADVI